VVPEELMPIHNFEQPRGRTIHLTVESKALEGNLLGDPTRRTVAVHLPPGYDDSDERYPLMVDLTGFTGSGLKHLSWQAFGESVPQRVERLIAAGRMGPTIVAFPDCFTSLGGNQYINSLAMGRWEDFLLEELLPLLERELRVAPGSAHRAVFGKSSGGYGAIVQGMRHGEAWGALACHSGDMGFDLVYRGDFPGLLRTLAKHGGIEPFLEKLRSADKIAGADMHALMILAMAATYDPDPDAPSGIRLPVDLETCELDPERWQRWLDHDPLHMIERAECRESLRKPKLVYIDCGFRDQYHLHFGARVLVRKMQEAGIEHRYEEFDDDHSSVDYRMDVSLPLLYGAIRPAGPA
jgi:enterochelin esterase-like enzyme